MEEKENFPRDILGFVYFCLAIATITLNWSFYKRWGRFGCGFTKQVAFVSGTKSPFFCDFRPITRS